MQIATFLIKKKKPNIVISTEWANTYKNLLNVIVVYRNATQSGVGRPVLVFELLLICNKINREIK